jgi:2-polyprenyl-6-methoxyphenol hydroxylase-like FAD-dependent oxidoreductase
MIFGKRAFFGFTVHPSGEIWWFANPPSKEEISRSELSAMTTEDWKSRLIDLFAADNSPAAPIIQATTEDISASNAYDMPPVRRWHRDRMIIIGDAAHAASPSSGQGASMAMEDAIVLAICLRDLGSPDSAFTRFEQLRRKRVEMVVAEGAKFSNQKAPGYIGRQFRDLLMPVFLKRVAGSGNQSLAWLFEYHVNWSQDVASLPLPA